MAAVTATSASAVTAAAARNQPAPDFCSQCHRSHRSFPIYATILKHPADRPSDSRPTKQQKTGSGMEPLSEESLPPDLAALNDKIYADVEKTFGVPPIPIPLDLKTFYEVVQGKYPEILRKLDAEDMWSLFG